MYVRYVHRKRGIDGVVAANFGPFDLEKQELVIKVLFKLNYKEIIRSTKWVREGNTLQMSRLPLPAEYRLEA